MTLKEAIAVLVAKDPERTYAANKSVWSHRAITPGAPRPDGNSGYRITVMPAINGTVCEIVDDTTIEAALEKALALFPSGKPDTNNE